MHFVDDINLEPCACRPIDDILAKLTNIFDTAVGSTVYFYYVYIIAEIYRNATLAFAAGFACRRIDSQAVKRFGQNSGHCCLSDTAGAGKKICVSDSVGLYRISESHSYGLLADDIAECL